MKAILERLGQGSTHAGLATLLQAAKFVFPQYAAVLDAGTALFGAIAVAINDKKPSA